MTRGTHGVASRGHRTRTGGLKACNNKHAMVQAATPSYSCFVTLCACPGASSAPSGCRRARMRWAACACSPLQCTGPYDPAPGTWASVSHQEIHPACTGGPQRRGSEETVQRQRPQNNSKRDARNRVTQATRTSSEYCEHKKQMHT